MVALEPREDETAATLLGKLQEMEVEFGRQRSGIVNEARILDLDLISFRQDTVQSNELTLPHPRAHERSFVLAPMMEITSDVIMIGQQEKIGSLLQKIDGQEIFRLVELAENNK